MSDTDIETNAGILNLYKPAGTTTAKFVYRLRPIFGIRKVGHAGTLDPFADGVVIACLGRATKLVEALMGLPKNYRTTLRLGVSNRSHDTEQPFEPVPGANPVPRVDVARAVAGLVGDIDQVPPVFSAVKIGGIPSYRLARRGRAEALAAKRVRIHQMEITHYDWPVLRLEIRCGRGTYIRAIARDLGLRLGCGACCETLTRIAVGPFRLEASVNPETTPDHLVRAALVPIAQAKRLLEPAGRREERATGRDSP